MRPQYVKRSLSPAVCFTVRIAADELAEDSFRASSGLIILACRQLVTPEARVKPERLSHFREPQLLRLVHRVEPTNHPAFAFNDGQTDDNRNRVFLPASLFETIATFFLVVLIADQHHAVEFRKENAKRAERPPSRRRVGFGGSPIEVTRYDNAVIRCELFDPLPGQGIAGVTSRPGPLMLDQFRFEPLDGFDQNAVGEIGRGPEIGGCLVHDGKGDAHFVAPDR